MRSRAEISEEAVRLAAQYSTDLEHTRYALSRAELFQLGSFWHGDRLKTESQLRAELEGTGLLESLAWVLKPSLAHALSLKDLDPGMVVRLFEIPEPWSVRQQRMLLLGFVPFSDLPFYTWDELARSLRSFHGFLLAQHDALVGTGLPETPFYESVWLHATAGPLYPNSALSPWTSPQFREKVLAAKTDIVGLLADGVRDVAGRAGGRSSCKAASDLWNRCCARLCALFADQDSSLRFRKELAQVNAASHATVEESSIGWGALAGSVTALMVVAMHCCKELSVGTFHKTRGLLGELVKPGSGGCPALVPETLPVWVGYKAILDPQKELDGIGLVKATALHLKLLKDEEPVWRQYVADLVSKVSGILDDPDSTPDGAMPDSVEDEILAFCQRLRSPLARLRAGLGPAVEIPMRPKLPKGMAWQDVGMNIEDKQKLHIWRRGEPRPTSIITLLFAELTFRDRRRPDDLQATEAWERFRSILDRVERQPDGTGILRPCQNRQDRNLDKQYIKTINDKLKALLDLDGVPLEYSAKVGAYRVLFESRPEPKPAKTPCFPS